MFKPKIIVPNSLNPDLGHLDWACMPCMFGDCLADGGQAAMRASMGSANVNINCLDYVAPKDDIYPTEIGAEMDNLVGEGAEDLARRWIGESGEDTEGTTTKECRIITRMGRFLGPRGKQLLTLQLNAIALRRGQGPNSPDSEGEGEVTAKGKAANVISAPTSPVNAFTVSAVYNMKHRPSGLLLPFTSLPLMTRVTPHRLHSLQHSPFHSSSFPCSVDSPFYSKVSQMSATSPPPPLFNTLHSSHERSYHLLFDALQLNKRPTSPAFSLPAALGYELSPPRTADFTSCQENGVFNSPYVAFSSLKVKEASRLPVMPLVSPSVTPSPSRPPSRHTPIHNLKGQVPLTPVSRSNVKPRHHEGGQLSDVMTRPPMLDLKKILKRSSSEAGLPRSATKRRATRSSFSTTVNFSSAAKSRLVSHCISMEGLDFRSGQVPSMDSPSAHISPLVGPPKDTPAVPSLGTIPSSRPISEKARRSKAKATQVRVRERLVRALPSNKITPRCMAKIERRTQALAELRARNKASIIARKQSVYGFCEVPFHPPPNLPGHRDTISGFPQVQTAIFDGSGMDWNKTRRYQEEFKTHRKEGIRYPPLPQLEKSFAESQSPWNGFFL